VITAEVSREQADQETLMRYMTQGKNQRKVAQQ